MSNNITLITMTQGNPVALKRTIDNVIESFEGLVNEVLVGDLCIFKDDRLKCAQIVRRIVPLKFNELFLNGFGATLNKLAESATNDLCLYMNVSEIVESNLNLSIINDTWNSYKFNHATDPHKWLRLWNRKQLQWSGRIHEEVIGTRYTCPDILFTMADTEKDSGDLFYSAVMNDIKELVYFNNYLKLVDSPGEQGATNSGWVNYVKDGYESIKGRMLAKGARYEAFVEGNLQKYLDNCQNLEGFENNKLIHFQ